MTMKQGQKLSIRTQVKDEMKLEDLKIKVKENNHETSHLHNVKLHFMKKLCLHNVSNHTKFY